MDKNNAEINFELLTKLYKMFMDKCKEAEEKEGSTPNEVIASYSQAAGIAFTLWNEVGYLYSDILTKVSLLQNPQQLQKKPSTMSPLDALTEMALSGKVKKSN